MNNLYTIEEVTTEHPSNNYHTFQLHVHDNYEIYLFLEGDTKYIIEENDYSLSSGDLIIIRKNQLHRTFHNSPKFYKRIILNIEPDFFKQNNVEEYERIFTDIKTDVGSKINSDIVKSSGIYDAFMRIKEYSKNFTNVYNVITKSVIIEILHLINNVNLYSVSKISNDLLKEIIEYINENFTTNVTLDSLQKKFFISKYHLCRIFLKATGLTVHNYITKKRLANAKNLIKNGISVLDASEKSGFNSYTSFYRAFLSEYGFSPKNKKLVNTK